MGQETLYAELLQQVIEALPPSTPSACGFPEARLLSAKLLLDELLLILEQTPSPSPMPLITER